MIAMIWQTPAGNERKLSVMVIRLADFIPWIFASLQFASSIPSGNQKKE
jgi:hypothetical protein